MFNEYGQTKLRLVDDGTYNILVTDLASGNWSVKNGTGIVEMEVEEKHGTIYLPGAPGGDYVLTPLSVP